MIGSGCGPIDEEWVGPINWEWVWLKCAKYYVQLCIPSIAVSWVQLHEPNVEYILYYSAYICYTVV